MDWGLLFVIVAGAFLVAHLAFDLRGVYHLLRTPHDAVIPRRCARCSDTTMNGQVAGIGLRREHGRRDILWTTAPIIALVGHVIMDFVG